MKYTFTVLVLSMLFFWGCASSPINVTQRNISLAEQLQGYCKNQNIQSEAISFADSLLALSKTSIKDGKDDEAYWQSDMAGIYYKLGITRQILKIEDTQLRELKKALSQDKEHLISLKEVYEEIKALRKQ